MCVYFNPHPLWRGRQNQDILVIFRQLFQSTPSVKRATLSSSCWYCPSDLFQSTPSVKRATSQRTVKSKTLLYFNPHPLWRGRLHQHHKWGHISLFQSTPSVKRATLYNSLNLINKRLISIHTLCEEGDCGICAIHQFFSYFNPHPLWRGRLWWECWANY